MDPLRSDVHSVVQVLPAKAKRRFSRLWIPRVRTTVNWLVGSLHAEWSTRARTGKDGLQDSWQLMNTGHPYRRRNSWPLSLLSHRCGILRRALVRKPRG